MKYCMKCGKKMQDDDAFCAHCGFGNKADIDPFGYDAPSDTIADMEDVQAPDVSEPDEIEQTEQAPAPAPSSAKYNKSLAQSVKSVMTGKKRGLLSSVFVLALSVVMLFVAVFAPVKVADYLQLMGRGSMSIDHVSDGTFKGSFAEIEQSVFQIIGAFTYLNPSTKQENALEKQLAKAQDEADTDLAVWMLTHPNASEYEVAQKQSEIYVKHVSDVNYFAYCFVKAKAVGMKDVRARMLIFLCVTALVVLLLLVTAVISLVYVIKCIVGLARRRPDIDVNKYLKVMLGMTGATLLTALLSPVTMSSGSPFGLFVFVAACMLGWSTLSALCDGADRIVIIKRVLSAALAFTVFVLLCCNCVKFVVNYGYNYVISCKPDIGCMGLVSSIPEFTGMEVSLAILYVLLGVCGGITAYVALAGVLKNCGNQDDKSFILGVRMIALAVFTVAAIVVGFSADTIATAFDEALGSTGGVSGVLVDVSTSIAGTVWAAAVLSVITAIFALVFKPKAMPQNNDGGEQPVEPVQSDGASAQEAAE